MTRIASVHRLAALAASLPAQEGATITMTSPCGSTLTLECANGSWRQR